MVERKDGGMITKLNDVIIMTGRGHTGKRHIVIAQTNSLCGLQKQFVGKLRPRDKTEARLICKVCLRKEHELEMTGMQPNDNQ